MDVKEYLDQAILIDKDIDSKTDMIRFLESLATNMTANMNGDRVQTSGEGRRMADSVDKIVDLQSEIDAKRISLCDLIEAMYKLIQKLDDKEERLVLEKKYFGHMTMRDIGYDLGVSERTVYRLYNSAIEKLNLMLKEAGKEREQ